jgi:hypothetical protein
MRMVWLKKYFLNWPAPVYVLLGSAFPVLYLYVYNISETNFGESALPLGLSLAGAVVLWALLTLILRSARKAGLGTVIFLFFFFTYGHLCDGLNYLGLPVPRHAYFIPTMLFIWGYCIYFLSRAKRDFRTTTTVLNVVAVALIVINLFNIASYEIKLASRDAGTPQDSPAQTPAASNMTELDTLPDIYFIILDEYAHLDTMKEWYDYDNSEFFDILEDKGFFIANESKTRAHITPQCLGQILNMEYLTAGWYWDEDRSEMRQIFSEEFGRVGGPWDDATFRKVGYNKVMYFLKAQGYQYIVFGCQITRVRWHRYVEDTADLYFNYYIEWKTPWMSEFQDTLWQTTMLRPFYYHLVGSQYETAWQRQTLYMLEHLKELPEVAGPKFVFAHFMCPHEPFVFGPNGEYIDPVNWRNYEDKQFYRDQYIFITKETEKLVDALLEKSEIPPIIILQSDHGMRPSHPNIEIGGDEWHKILNAMYLPGMNYSEISPAISPVNTFRLIFSQYFGADYPLLEDD